MQLQNISKMQGYRKGEFYLCLFFQPFWQKLKITADFGEKATLCNLSEELNLW